MIFGGSGSGKTNALLDLVSQKDDVEKIYLHARDLRGPRYQFLIRKRENAGIKYLNDSKTFIEFSNTVDDICENINDCNPTSKRKTLIFLMT